MNALPDVRLMEASDVTPLAEIVALNYCADYARQFRIEAAEALRLRIFAPVFWVAVAQNEAIGCAAWLVSGIDWNIACLTWVNVAPHLQRKGVGRHLVGRVLRDAASSHRAIMLTTRTPGWYEHWGFKTVSLLNGERDEPHHLMVRDQAKAA